MFNNISAYLKNEEWRVSVLNNGVHILNYKSIVDITSNEAIFKIDKKLIKISGNNMSLVELDKKEILIKGNIKMVSINES